MKRVILFVLGLLLLPFLHAAQRPNILFIFTDDHAAHAISAYGSKINTTPNMDRLANEGMLFKKCYVSNSICGPSRAVIMTGKHSHKNGFMNNGNSFDWTQQIFPKLLQKAGYTTGMFGKWGLGAPGSEGDPVKQGWDEFYGYNCQRQAHTYYPPYLWHNDKRVPLDGKTYSHDLIHEQSLKFIRDNAKRPFFAYLPITIPHAAMHVPEEDAAPFRKKFPEHENKIGRYRGPEVRNPAAMFAGMMTRMDRGVGEVLDLLDELKIADNTLVLFTSDNGPHHEGGHLPGYFNSNGPLRGHKRDLYEGGIRVPLIACWPGKVKAGTVSNHISAHWDLMPTLCELAGIRIPKHTDGISYVPTLYGGKQKQHDYLYWEFHAQGKKQAIRMGDWKAVRLNLAKNPDAPIQLYNLSKDIGETKDIAAQPPDVVKRIKPIFTSARVESGLFTLFPKRKLN